MDGGIVSARARDSSIWAIILVVEQQREEATERVMDCGAKPHMEEMAGGRDGGAYPK
jgi:hypothetical protein